MPVQFRERPARLLALCERRGTDIAALVACTRRRSARMNTAPRASSFPRPPSTLTVQVQFRERPARLHALRDRRGTDIADLVACTRRRSARMNTSHARARSRAPATLTVQVQYRKRPARLHALRKRRGTDIADLVVCARRRSARISTARAQARSHGPGHTHRPGQAA